MIGLLLLLLVGCPDPSDAAFLAFCADMPTSDGAELLVHCGEKAPRCLDLASPTLQATDADAADALCAQCPGGWTCTDWSELVPLCEDPDEKRLVSTFQCRHLTPL